ncbi:MAG: tRNA (guanosine(46)-N7)-methyltransferase TrmB [Lachnospiraceae bacterium]|nr:tRNA (guanosine(46)-N7)-methyltransferase TrmB [Lachnospiraceae bacterium]
MRLRNIPRADEAVAASPFVINEPAALRGRWKEHFGNDHPIRIEVGMGKGRFLRDLAALNPDVNYVGIERYTSVLLRAVEKAEADQRAMAEAATGAEGKEGCLGREEQPIEAAPTNFYFMCQDAAILPELFAPGEVDRIYLNFSDPWPKKGHAKRRLTSSRFLACYDKILKADGTVEFKTDNQELFTFSLESAREAGWEILAYTGDLHNDPMCEGNVMTEYEEKFSSQGNPICKMIICRHKG